DTLVQPNPLPWDQWQQVLAHCYARTTLVDAAGGMFLARLTERGLAESTMVARTTDHEEAEASRRGHDGKHSYLREEMIRIPMAVRWPERFHGGQVRRELVGQTDLFPTVLDAAGVPSPAAVDGASLLPLLTGESSAWREEIVTETFGHGEDLIGRALVGPRYKYVLYEGIGEELYDLLTDPYEKSNLVDVAEHADLLAAMRERLARWRAEHEDVGTEHVRRCRG